MKKVSPITALTRFLTVLSLCLAAAATASAQTMSGTSVTTDPVGFNSISLPAGNSIRVNTFVQPKAYQGQASSVSNAANSVIAVSGTTLTSGSFNQVSGKPTYFVEILDSGATQGLMADVVSNTAGAITVGENLATLGVSGTATFCVRPHTTLSSLFASSSGLAPFVDSIKLFYPNGSSSSFLFTGSGTNWIDAGSGADAGNEVIYPGQGFLVNVASTKMATITGAVKTGPTQVPLYAGVVNVVGTFNPLVSGTQTLANFNFPSTFAAFVDAANVYRDDGSFTAVGSYLSSGSAMIDGGSGASGDATTVPPSSGTIVSVANNKNWLMPSFYTSGQ